MQDEEKAPRRSSLASRRTCSSSPSLSFFPNASRSPRDLTSLAARVHGPTPNDVPQRLSSLDSAMVRNSEGHKDALSTGRKWQLPSLNFRPLSFVNCAPTTGDRPKSAEGMIQTGPTDIISPTPERPVSSQSRRRFSKILCLEDDQCVHLSTVSRSYNSLNFGKLKRVAEVPESNYPARLSIPAYSPRKSTIEEAADETELNIVDAVRDERASQNTSNAKSTVESLLDKHIECLGLQPNVPIFPPQTKIPADDASCGRHVSGITSTVKLSQPSYYQDWQRKTRPRTASSADPSVLASPERELLVPKKLFSTRTYPMTRSDSSGLTNTRSLPCMAEAAATHQTTGRPSTGWRSLASTAQCLSSPHTDNALASGVVESPRAKDSEPLRHQSRRRSAISTSLSLTSSQGRTTEDLFDWDDEADLQSRLRDSLLAKQASQRRKLRVRLKLKRNSLSQGKLGSCELPAPSVSTHTALELSQALSADATNRVHDRQQDVEVPSNKGKTQAYLNSTHDFRTAPVPSQTADCSSSIPRQSSGVANVPEVVRSSSDIRRKTSTKTARSHRSNTSLADPINSTRLSAPILRPSMHLSRPSPTDLGPSMSALHLDMGARYPDVAANPRPMLREARSFFSDDSSAIHHQRGSLRKRLHLHSLRGVLPSSPRATVIDDVAKTTPKRTRSRLGQPHTTRDEDSHEHERDLYGTVGMTDFAYRKKRLVIRLKDWWKRHSMQRKLGLKRKKSCKSVTNSAHGRVREV